MTLIGSSQFGPRARILSLVGIVLAVCQSLPAAANDIVIQNGRVIDPETGLDAIRNVAVEDGRIVAISELPLQGDTVIDATGHVVAPGFIDIHAHGQNIGDYRMQAMQGVTTMLELESGVLPIAEWYAKQPKRTCRSITGRPPVGPSPALPPSPGSNPSRRRSISRRPSPGPIGK